MPNMFGSGPLAMTLQQLANEVWEEVSCAAGQLWKRKKGCREVAFREVRGPTAYQCSAPSH